MDVPGVKLDFAVRVEFDAQSSRTRSAGSRLRAPDFPLYYLGLGKGSLSLPIKPCARACLLDDAVYGNLASLGGAEGAGKGRSRVPSDSSDLAYYCCHAYARARGISKGIGGIYATGSCDCRKDSTLYINGCERHPSERDSPFLYMGQPESEFDLISKSLYKLIKTTYIYNMTPDLPDWQYTCG